MASFTAARGQLLMRFGGGGEVVDGHAVFLSSANASQFFSSLVCQSIWRWANSA
jgi:hypothetical protein